MKDKDKCVRDDMWIYVAVQWFWYCFWVVFIEAYGLMFYSFVHGCAVVHAQPFYVTFVQSCHFLM